MFVFLEGEKVEAKIKRLEQKYSRLQVSTIIEKFGNPKVKKTSVVLKFVFFNVHFCL